MRRTIAVLALSLSLVAACDPETPAPGRTDTRAPATHPVSPSTADIKKLCDFFYGRPHEVLLTSGAEGNVSLLAGGLGVPGELAATAKAYYAGQPLGKPIGAAQRGLLDERYAAVINTCQRYGWVAS